MQDPRPRPARAKGARSVIERELRRVLFASRWLLAPLYFGLVFCLLAIVVQAGEKLVAFVLTLNQQSESATIIAVLGLVDLTLTGSLIVIVIFSGYENFIAKVDDAESRNWPEWMAAIDFSGLKLKLLSSLVAISSIRLLEAFMNLDHETDRNLIWYVGIHLTFVASGLVLALTDRFADEPHHGAGQPTEGAADGE